MGTFSYIIDTNRFPKKQPNFYNKNVPPTSTTSTINYKSNTTTKSTSSTGFESTVAELPETFGLPLNKLKKSLPKYTSSSLSSTTTSLLNATNSDIQIISAQSKIGESVSAPTLTVTNKQYQQDNEIEIISENFPISSSTSSTSSIQQKQALLNKNLSLNSTNITTTTDEKFKEYLSKNYNMDLSVACKPQCNFVSNISCIDQCIKQTNYYENYLKKQQGFNKRIKFNSFSSDVDDENAGDSISKIKKQKIIVIDDTDEGGSDEAQKPWITPQLINLIKQRNLLQSKLTAQGKEPDAEMNAKFKSLRNKVTKLVKNARSMI